ncbi:MAG: ATP-binding cassette domain-containing protein, partial [Blastocatellia bacterium]
MENLLTVKDLVKHYPIKQGLVPKIIGYVRAVNGVSFSIERGTTLGLVGESGCGKTTIGRCILRLVEPTSGVVIFDERNLLDLNARQMRGVRRDCQIVFQDPYGSLNPRMTIGAIIEEPLLVHGVNPQRREPGQE